ncbi:hypothetical protein C8F01DRAFT_500442 [Mycena amicta]|nr:hypothetical protein C8F01DRAFT_500442 [Mycena amicta]
MAPSVPSNFIAELPVGITVHYFVFSLVAQTLFFGSYTLLVILVSIKRYIKSESSSLSLTILLAGGFMYLLSALYWVYSVVDVADRINTLAPSRLRVSNFALFVLPDVDLVAQSSPLVNAIVFINYILSDAFLIWRGWIFCQSSPTRRYLCISIAALCGAAIAAVTNIASRAAFFPTDRVADILEVLAFGLSVLSNLSATSVVGWHMHSCGSPVGIKALVVDGGLVYALSSLSIFAARFIPLSIGVLSSVYMPINVQISSAYPAAIMLLITKDRALNAPIVLMSDGEGRVVNHAARLATAPTVISSPLLTLTPPPRLRVPEPSGALSRFSEYSL